MLPFVFFLGRESFSLRPVSSLNSWGSSFERFVCKEKRRTFVTAKAIPARLIKGERDFPTSASVLFSGKDGKTPPLFKVRRKNAVWFCRFGKRFYFCTHCPLLDRLCSGEVRGSNSAIIDIVHTKNKSVVQEGERRASPFLAGDVCPLAEEGRFTGCYWRNRLSTRTYTLSKRKTKRPREKKKPRCTTW